MPCLIQYDRDEQDDGGTMVKSRSKVLECKDRAVPVGIYGHEQIETGQGKGYRQEKDIDPGIKFTFIKIIKSAGRILFQ